MLSKKALVQYQKATHAAIQELIDSVGDEAGGSEAESSEVEFPSLVEINKMGKEKLVETCKSISIDTADLKIAGMRDLLIGVYAITHEEEIEEATAKTLVTKLGMTPKKKHEDNVTQLREYLSAETESEDTAESAEEEAAEEEEEADEEEVAAPKAKKKAAKPTAKEEAEEEEEETAEEEAKEEAAEEDPADGVDRAAVAKSFDAFPALAEMKEQLAAYNEKAEELEVEPIEVEEGKTKAAYRKLVAELVSSDEEVAEWGTPYIRDSAAYCCGLPLADAKVKGYEQAGKCVVTGKTFALDAENDFIEVTAKKK